MYYFFNKLVWKLRILIPSKIFARIRGVKIGANSIFDTRNIGSEPFLITIGDHCHITNGVSFVNHDGGVWVFREKIPSFDVFGKINIGDNTYIGNDVVILPGVAIGKNCVVGASSIVTKSIPDHCVVAGNPAKFICHIDAYYDKMKSKNFTTKGLSGVERKNAIIDQIAKGLKKDKLKVPS